MLQILQWAWFPSANVIAVFQIFAFNITEDDWILMYSNVLSDVLAKGNEWEKKSKNMQKLWMQYKQKPD